MLYVYQHPTKLHAGHYLLLVSVRLGARGVLKFLDERIQLLDLRLDSSHKYTPISFISPITTITPIPLRTNTML